MKKFLVKTVAFITAVSLLGSTMIFGEEIGEPVIEPIDIGFEGGFIGDIDLEPGDNEDLGEFDGAVEGTSNMFTEESEPPDETVVPLEAGEIVASGECGIDGDNLTWTLDSDGVLTISGEGEMCSYFLDRPWDDYQNDIIQCVINDGVTSIGENAFFGCFSLNSVNFPNSLKSIDSRAFGYTSLNSVVFPSGLISIDYGAFGYCDSLKSIRIPSSVESIYYNAFSSCSSLVSIEVEDGNTNYKAVDNVLYDIRSESLICYPAGKMETAFSVPEGVKIIEEDAFFDCSSLVSIDIPDSVNTIKSSFSFCGCTSLKTINVDPENKYYKSIDGVLYDIDVKTLCCYPAGREETSFSIPKSVLTIDSVAFYESSSLETVEIPESLTSIGVVAFSDSTSLTSIVIPDSVTAVGGRAFSYCSSLKTVKISKNMTKIDDSLFYSCKSLTAIEIPHGITSIGEEAFRACTSLTAIKIPQSVTVIDSDAFLYCSDDLTIYGYYGSYAETYANEHDILFKYIYEYPGNIPAEDGDFIASGVWRKRR